MQIQAVQFFGGTFFESKRFTRARAFLRGVEVKGLAAARRCAVDGGAERGGDGAQRVRGEGHVPEVVARVVRLGQLGARLAQAIRAWGW